MKEQKQQYSKAALRFLSAFCPDHLYEEIEGDLIQKFNRDVELQGIQKAKRKFIWNTIRFFRPAIIARNKRSTTSNSTAMLLNFIKTGIRFNLKERFYSTLNLLGLMVGLVSVMILAAFAYNEFSYDKFHPDYKKIYRLTTHFNYGGRETSFALNRGIFHLLLDSAKDIESSVAFMKIQSSPVFEVDNKFFSENRGYYSDESFFSVFDFHLLSGVRTRCLKEPNSIVITQDMAEKLFNSTDVLNRTIRMKNQSSTTELVVTGVVERLPINSHLNFNFIISADWKDFFTVKSDGNMPFYIYFKTAQELSPLVVQENVNRIFSTVQEKDVTSHIQPLDEIYFNAKNEFEITAGGNLQYVKIFIWVGIALLFITIVNFINISTSHSLKRIKEIGVRKSLGTTRSSLILQFITESVFVTLVTTILSYGIAVFFLYSFSPSFYPIELSIITHFTTFLGVAGFGILLGLLAGIYPSLKITTIRTTQALKGKITLSKEAIYSPRNILVLVQLIFTISLFSFLLLMHRQINFINAHLHTSHQDNILYFNKPNSISFGQWEEFQKSISAQSSIGLTSSSLSPIIENDLGRMNSTPMLVGDDYKNHVQAVWNYINFDFIETMGMTMMEGRSFSRDFPSDSSAIIINEAARKALGLKEAVGAEIKWSMGSSKVVGVVRDFHFQSFNNKIAPVIFALAPFTRIMYARTANPRLALESIENVWKNEKIDAPFDPRFLDDSFKKMLEKESRLSGVIIAFTGIALLVMGIGTLGLIGYVVAQKQKEIGIRKVFGATVFHILLRLNFRFVILLAIAIVCSSLLVYKISYQWLSTFEYKVDFSMVDYLLGAGIVTVLSFFIIEAQAIRAALINPVKTLKHE